MNQYNPTPSKHFVIPHVRFVCPRNGTPVSCRVCKRPVPHHVERWELELAVPRCEEDGEWMVKA
jgi:hypothetical protein